MHRPRMLLLAGLAPLLSLPSAASAVCQDALCVSVPVPVSASVTVNPGSGDDGSGVLCAYTKLTGEPPHGYGGDGGAPYFWVETQRWGKQYPHDWDFQACPPLCPTATTPVGLTPCVFIEIGPPQ